MSGRRPLTPEEERRFLRTLRKLDPRDRALFTTQWLTGFRISEVLSLSVGSVFRKGQLVEQIGVPPRRLKGKRGGTRWVPMAPELRRALTPLLRVLEKQHGLTPELPLFVSRMRGPDGSPKPMTRFLADKLLKRTCALAGIDDDGRLGTHSLRKTFARNVYRNSGNDIMVLKAALHHSSLATTEKYLEASEEEVRAAILASDPSRRELRLVRFQPRGPDRAVARRKAS